MATSIADAKFLFLRNLGHTGSNSDMLLQYLQVEGATSDQLNAAWAEMLASKGRTEGTVTDAQFAWLRSLGHTGSISDMFLQFWCNTVPPPVLTRFLFNGADQHATMPAWNPWAENYLITATVELTDFAIDPSAAIVASATANANNNFSLIDDAPDGINARAGAATGVYHQPGAAFPGGAKTFYLDVTDAGGKVGLSGGTESSREVAFGGFFTDGGLSRIAIGFESPERLHGIITNLSIVDRSPLHNRDVVYGNNDHYVELDSDVVPTAGAWSITLDGIRGDSTAGAGATAIISGSEGSSSLLSINDTDHATLPDGLSIVVLSGIGDASFTTLVNVFEDVAIGARFQCVLAGGVTDFTATVNGVLKATLVGNTFTPSVDSIGNNAGPMSSTMTYANIHFVGQGGVDELWELDEASGSSITGTSVDGDWVTAPATTTDPTRTALATNNRAYAMDEGSGSTFIDSLGGHDATIINPVSVGGGWVA